MIHVEQRPLRPLEQHPLPGAADIVQHLPRRSGEGQDLRSHVLQGLQQGTGVHVGQVQPPAQGLVVGEQPGDLGLQRHGIGQVRDPHGPTAHLVLVGRADAAAGGADLARTGGCLPGGVQVPVDRQDQAGIVGQGQQLRPDGDALALDPGDLVEQGPGVDDHAVADDGRLALHHPGGEQGQFVGLVPDHQGVAGIVSALEAHDDIGPVGQPVDDLALALVTPLGAYDCNIGHG